MQRAQHVVVDLRETHGGLARSADLDVACDFLQVRYRGSRVEDAKCVIRARVITELRYPAVRVVHVTEYNRLRWAALRAGRRHVAVLHRAVLVSGGLLAVLDSLHTERTFLHDAGAAAGHIRIQL